MKATPKTTVSMPKVIGATVVKLPKAKKLPGALAKPSKFYKGEEISEIKKPSIQKLSDFLNSVSSNQSKLRKYDFNEDYMSNDKKISAEEAARAVLAKVAEMLQASPLVKAASYEKGINPSVGASSKGSAMTPGKKAVMGQSKAGRSLEDTQGVGPAISAKPKAEGVLNEIKAMPKPNIPGPKPQSMIKDESSSDASSMSSKGIHKLSKFVGKMEGKKGAGHPNGETGHEKGINTASDPKHKSRVMLGTSKAGSQMPANNAEDRSEAKQEHKKVLGEMKAMPKPNLTKSEDQYPHEGTVTAKHGEMFAKKKDGGLHHLPNKEHAKTLLGQKVKFGVNEMDDAVLHPQHAPKETK